jgi:carboxyl-terminal processing protease
MRKFFLTLLLLVATLLGAGGLTAPARAADTLAPRPETKHPGLAAAKGLTDEQRKKNRESFEVVWKTIRDAHYDPKLGGVDWDAAYKESLPRLEEADTMAKARDVMNEMLDRLGHSHLGVFPASLYEDKANEEAIPGFAVRMLNGAAVVVQVTQGLPAAEAGVRPGWVVRKINDEDLGPPLAKISREIKKQAYACVAQASVIQHRLAGEEGKEVKVTFLDGAGKEVALSMPRARPKGNRVKIGQLPPNYVHFEARTLDKGIAYFFLSSFSDPMRVMKAFGDTVQDNLKAEGFILDLRGNPGGYIAMTQGLGGWFVDQPGLKLGTLMHRKSSVHLVLNPREVTYEGPLAILVDEFSMSSSEFLAGGLQDLKRARSSAGQPWGSPCRPSSSACPTATACNT